MKPQIVFKAWILKFEFSNIEFLNLGLWGCLDCCCVWVLDGISEVVWMRCLFVQRCIPYWFFKTSKQQQLKDTKPKPSKKIKNAKTNKIKIQKQWKTMISQATLKRTEFWNVSFVALHFWILDCWNVGVVLLCLGSRCGFWNFVVECCDFVFFLSFRYVWRVRMLEFVTFWKPQRWPTMNLDNNWSNQQNQEQIRQLRVHYWCSVSLGHCFLVCWRSGLLNLGLCLKFVVWLNTNLLIFEFGCCWFLCVWCNSGFILFGTVCLLNVWWCWHLNFVSVSWKPKQWPAKNFNNTCQNWKLQNIQKLKTSNTKTNQTLTNPVWISRAGFRICCFHYLFSSVCIVEVVDVCELLTYFVLPWYHRFVYFEFWRIVHVRRFGFVSSFWTPTMVLTITSRTKTQ